MRPALHLVPSRRGLFVSRAACLGNSPTKCREMVARIGDGALQLSTPAALSGRLSHAF